MHFHRSLCSIGLGAIRGIAMKYPLYLSRCPSMPLLLAWTTRVAYITAYRMHVDIIRNGTTAIAECTGMVVGLYC